MKLFVLSRPATTTERQRGSVTLGELEDSRLSTVEFIYYRRHRLNPSQLSRRCSGFSICLEQKSFRK